MDVNREGFKMHLFGFLSWLSFLSVGGEFVIVELRSGIRKLVRGFICLRGRDMSCMSMRSSFVDSYNSI